MSHNVTPNTSRVELRKTLTLVPVVMMGLAYMQPMTLFDTFGIVSGLTDGHVPTAYAFALIAILFTALSYGNWCVATLPRVRRIPMPRNPSADRWLYGGLVFSARLSVRADDQHSVGENLF